MEPITLTPEAATAAVLNEVATSADSSTFDAIYNAVASALGAVANFFSSAWSNASKEGITTFFAKTWKEASFEGVKNGAYAAASKAGGFISKNASTVVDFVKSFFNKD